MSRDNDDVLNRMTKSELIAWINENSFRTKPTLKWLLFHQWEAKSIANQAKRAANTRALSAIDTKGRDALAVRFNQSTDSTERLHLAIKIGAIDKQIRENIQQSVALGDEYDKIQKIYDQYQSL